MLWMWEGVVVFWPAEVRVEVRLHERGARGVAGGIAMLCCERVSGVVRQGMVSALVVRLHRAVVVVVAVAARVRWRVVVLRHVPVQGSVARLHGLGVARQLAGQARVHHHRSTALGRVRVCARLLRWARHDGAVGRHCLQAEAHVALLEVAALAASVALDWPASLESLAPLPLRLLQPVPSVADRIIGPAGQLLSDERPLAPRLGHAL
eukprot:scaffold12766_cov117-Isochrysis_galbana.AAC.4